MADIIGVCRTTVGSKMITPIQQSVAIPNGNKVITINSCERTSWLINSLWDVDMFSSMSSVIFASVYGYDAWWRTIESLESFRLIKVIWWRHQMKTFSALLAICAGNSPVPGEFLAQRPVTRSFDVFFDLRWINRVYPIFRGFICPKVL